MTGAFLSSASRWTAVRKLLLLPLLIAAACSDATGLDADAAVAAVAVDPAEALNAGTLVSPSLVELAPGAGVRLVALDAAGKQVRASWSSSAPEIASVSANGQVTAHAEGTASITAATRGGSASATVRVVAPAAFVPAPAVGCDAIPHTRLVSVSTASALGSALAGAQPGDQIRLADGVYTGHWKATVSGRSDARISLCGGRGAVLTTGSLDSGHALWLNGASYWTVAGVTLREALGGLSISGGSHNLVENLEIHSLGQHAVHVGTLSSANVLRGNVIHRTGLRKPEYGEGIYVGSYHTSWCARTGCQPDRSDGNQVLGNRIGPYVTAEHVQVMEGTTGGVIRGNVFDGTGMGAAAHPYADSWVAVMGNGWTVEENRGAGTLRNGFEVWVELDGWGSDNVFRRNDADVRAGGYGFHVNSRALRTVVGCDNAVRNAGSGFANVGCG